MSIFDHFKHLTLSPDQEATLTKLEAFLKSPVPVFMLKGYAGSGKTTILKGLAEYLHATQKSFDLMAPTGRAAKVIREKTDWPASTIHRSIYSYKSRVEVEEGESFYCHYEIRDNADVAGLIFIVDEASMLSDAQSESEFFRFGSGRLLSDLINYTRVAHKGAGSKIIFVGDPCQLPPVGDNSSKAFDAGYLRERFSLLSEETEMKEVRRQGGESGILKAAAKFRKSISSGFFNDFNLRENGRDIWNPPYGSFLDAWQQAEGSKIIIAYKNKTCLGLNLEIRERRFGAANLPIQRSDVVIMGGNNYPKGVFNGEFAVVNEISETTTERTIPLKGKASVTLCWRDVELIFPDAESNSQPVKGKVLENFLNGENTLRPEETQALYVDFKNRHKGLKPKTEMFKEAIRQDEYLNCLLMKYGYAVTCHKAQGGEWDNVFTVWDHDNTGGFNHFTEKQQKAGKTNQDFYRWAYTAITRASKKLYALNPPFFNPYSAMAFVKDASVLNTLSELTGAPTQTEEIDLSPELLEQLKALKLLEQPDRMQDHFVKVRQAVMKRHIEVVDWEKVKYEIRYTFRRGDDKAVFRTYINGQNEFKNPMTSMPNLSPKVEFNKEIEESLTRLPNVSIKRDTPQMTIDKSEIDFGLEEQPPFIENLFDDLVLLLEGIAIRIDGLEHQQYKERYTFKRNNETAVIDVGYDKNGSFGRIVLIPKKTNSLALISDIHAALKILRHKEDAI